MVKTARGMENLIQAGMAKLVWLPGRSRSRLGLSSCGITVAALAAFRANNLGVFVGHFMQKGRKSGTTVLTQKINRIWAHEAYFRPLLSHSCPIK